MSPLPFDDDRALLAFYRGMSTGNLQLYLGALTGDRLEAERRPGKATHSIEWCQRRLDLVTQVLAERAVAESTS
jgi:hypothetical protein